MPNHCKNILRVSKRYAPKIWKEYSIPDQSDPEKRVFSLNKIVPEPEDNEDWYSWRLAHWGTKWDTWDAELDGDNIIFTTAWSPPIEAIQALAQKYPRLEFALFYADEFSGGPVGMVDITSEGVETIASEGGLPESERETWWDRIWLGRLPYDLD